MMKAGGAAHRDSRARRSTGPGNGSLYPAQELKRRAMAWAVMLRVNPKVIRVQEMRRKWGSCSSAGTVTLASDLVEQEERFQDYVIVHELLHLRFSTHGRMFKALMSAHVPGWRRWEVARRCNAD
jgi:predicted metal-dependent hydrolase